VGRGDSDGGTKVDGVRGVLRAAERGTVQGLLESVARDAELAGDICREVYESESSPADAAQDASEALELCRRGLKLMDSEILKAADALKSIAAGSTGPASARDVARMLEAVCASTFGVQATEPPEGGGGGGSGGDGGDGGGNSGGSGGGRLGTALRRLLRSMHPSATTGASLAHAIAFLMSPAAAADSMAPCAKIAIGCMTKASAALLSPALLQPPETREQQEAAAAAKLRRRANEERKQVPALYDVLQLTGLAPVKKRFFGVRDRIKLSVERQEDVGKENHNTIFIGNPGQGGHCEQALDRQ